MQHNDYHFRIAEKEDIPLVFHLLKTVFRPTYGAILSEDQMDWMLATIFSEEMLLKQFQQKNFRFILLKEEKELAGFAAIESDFEGKIGICKLHKLYLHTGFQKQGLGKLLLNKAIQVAKGHRQKAFQLNENRHNSALDFYLKSGFHIVADIDIPLENGYFMNDYILKKEI